jgi:hypothetical protein
MQVETECNRFYQQIVHTYHELIPAITTTIPEINTFFAAFSPPPYTKIREATTPEPVQIST